MVERGPVLVGQNDRMCAGNRTDGSDAGSAGNRNDQIGKVHQPGERDLARACLVTRGDCRERLIDGRPSSTRRTAAKRAIGQQRQAVGHTVVGYAAQQVIGSPRAQLDLDRVDVGDPARVLDLADGDVAEADRFDEPAIPQARQGAHARRERRPRVGRVQLIQGDPIYADGAATLMACLDQMFCTAIRFPAAAWPCQSALGGHAQEGSIARPCGDRAGDQALVVAAIRPRRARTHQPCRGV